MSEGKIVSIPQGKLPTPNSPVATVTERFAESGSVAKTLLDLFIGADGTGRYLNDLTSAITAAPITEIVSPSITIPDLSTAIDWSESSLTTDIYAPLLTRMINDLQAGATGLSEEVENAMFARAIAREQLANDTEYNNALNDISGRNFSMPGGALNAAIIELTDKRAARIVDITNDILIENGRLAQANSQSVIQQSVSLEGLIRQSKANIDTTKLDFAKTSPGLVLHAFVEKLRAQVAVAEVTLKSEVEAGKLTLEGYSVESLVREKVAESSTNIIAQAVASLYSSVNASASISYTGSESKSESFGHTESLGETHVWDDNEKSLP